MGAGGCVMLARHTGQPASRLCHGKGIRQKNTRRTQAALRTHAHKPFSPHRATATRLVKTLVDALGAETVTAVQVVRKILEVQAHGASCVLADRIKAGRHGGLRRRRIGRASLRHFISSRASSDRSLSLPVAGLQHAGRQAEKPRSVRHRRLVDNVKEHVLEGVYKPDASAVKLRTGSERFKP